MKETGGRSSFWLKALVRWRHWLRSCAPAMSCELALAARPSRLRLGRFRAATIRRWGDADALEHAARVDATRHFFARRARRALRDRAPVLPLRDPALPRRAPVVPLRAPGAMRSPPLPLNAGKGDPLGDLVMEEAPIVCGVEKPVRAQDPASKPARQRGPSGRSVEAMLALCPSFYRRAEQREAPALYDDLTDGGRISACQAVSRFPWQQATLESPRCGVRAHARFAASRVVRGGVVVRRLRLVRDHAGGLPPAVPARSQRRVRAARGRVLSGSASGKVRLAAPRPLGGSSPEVMQSPSTSRHLFRAGVRRRSLSRSGVSFN